MLSKLFIFIRALFTPEPVRLAIVRKYQDANGNSVGELYLEQEIKRKHDTLTGFVMIGVSLDSFPLNTIELWPGEQYYTIDTLHDFLAPMPPNRIRVGALDPKDNDRVRKMVRWLPRHRMMVTIENKFIERILEQR